jgi:hypothetical protein
VDNGPGENPCDPHPFTTSRVTGVRRGRNHDDRQIIRIHLVTDTLGEVKAIVHFGYDTIEQHKPKGPVGRGCTAYLIERLSASYSSRLGVPTRQKLSLDAPIRIVVVNDKHPQALQRRALDHGLIIMLPPFEHRRKMERRALAQLAIEPKVSSHHLNKLRGDR